MILCLALSPARSSEDAPSWHMQLWDSPAIPKTHILSCSDGNATPKPLSSAALIANTAERQSWISAAPPLSSSRDEKHQNRAEICFWPPSGVLASLRGFDLSLPQKGKRKPATTDMNPLYPFSLSTMVWKSGFPKIVLFHPHCPDFCFGSAN